MILNFPKESEFELKIYNRIDFEKPISTYLDVTTTISDKEKKQMAANKTVIAARKEMDLIIVGLIDDKQHRIKFAQMIEGLRVKKIKLSKLKIRKISGYFHQLRKISNELRQVKTLNEGTIDQTEVFKYVKEYQYLGLLNTQPDSVTTLLVHLDKFLSQLELKRNTAVKKGPDNELFRRNLFFLKEAFSRRLKMTKIKGQIKSLEGIKLDERNKLNVTTRNLLLLACICVGETRTEDTLKKDLYIK